MKIKCFFLLSLIVTTVSLTALPMDRYGEETKSGDENQRLLRQGQEERTTTGGQESEGVSSERGDGSGGFVDSGSSQLPATQPLPEEPIKKTTIERITSFLQRGVASGDINHKGFGIASETISRLKQRSDAVLNPPAPSWISSWWSSPPASPGETERAAAIADKIQCLAIEASLPAWKQNALAIAAKRKFDRAAAEPAEPAETAGLSCWDFWKKVPVTQNEPVNLYGDVIQKWEATEAAWISAKAEFEKERPQDLSSLPLNEQTLWENASKELEQNQTLASAKAAGWKSDQDLESALIFYKDQESHNPSLFERVMEGRLALYDAFQESKDRAPQAYKAQWDTLLKQADMNANLWGYKFHRTAAEFAIGATEAVDDTSAGMEQMKLALNEKSAARNYLQHVSDTYKQLIPAESLAKIEGATTDSREADMPLLTEQEKHWSEKIAQFKTEIDFLSDDMILLRGATSSSRAIEQGQSNSAIESSSSAIEQGLSNAAIGDSEGTECDAAN